LEYDNEKDCVISDNFISNIYNGTIQAITTAVSIVLGTATNANWVYKGFYKSLN